MELYNRNVNYSIFDGEITLNTDAKNYLLRTLFSKNKENRDIRLVINGNRYKARLMNVSSSESVQISYSEEVKELFKSIFKYSYDYCKNSREEAKRIGYSTRKIPAQKLERIIVSETDEYLVYKIEYINIPYDITNRESEEGIEYLEGRKIYRKHISYERNQGIVKLAKQRFKELHNGCLFCEVCGFSFMEKYGEDYIEAHHTIPVSQLGDGGVTHIEDLRMVCANCHRMLHRIKNITVEELKNNICYIEK